MSSPEEARPSVRYWDRVSNEKSFSHPLRIDWLRRYLDRAMRILDFGCGYGRILIELLRADYRNALGVDSSFGMLARGQSTAPGLMLLQNSGQTIPLRSHSIDLVLAFSVFTCIPRNEDQLLVLLEIRRVLRPNGLLYMSDLLLNEDTRNRERYDRFAERYGTYGIFELPEGVLLRHHRKEWIEELTRPFDRLEYQSFEALTMNGNKSAAFQYLGRKRDRTIPLSSNASDHGLIQE